MVTGIFSVPVDSPTDNVIKGFSGALVRFFPQEAQLGNSNFACGSDQFRKIEIAC
jgi:hypothetical protein